MFSEIVISLSQSGLFEGRDLEGESLNLVAEGREGETVN